MPKKISVSDPVYERIISARDALAAAIDRQVTISEIVEYAFEAWDQTKPKMPVITITEGKDKP